MVITPENFISILFRSMDVATFCYFFGTPIPFLKPDYTPPLLDTPDPGRIEPADPKEDPKFNQPALVSDNGVA